MKNDEELLNIAKDASKLNYAPYSNFNVGACVLFKTGNIYKGSNIENASYGLSLCAERNAIASGISNGENCIIKVAIYSPNKKLCFPCGACRQWIKEFSNDNENESVKIILEDENNKIKVFSINELLPYSFKI